MGVALLCEVEVEVNTMRAAIRVGELECHRSEERRNLKGKRYENKGYMGEKKNEELQNEW